jgi:hypothetical protein
VPRLVLDRGKGVLQVAYGLALVTLEACACQPYGHLCRLDAGEAAKSVHCRGQRSGRDITRGQGEHVGELGRQRRKKRGELLGRVRLRREEGSVGRAQVR